MKAEMAYLSGFVLRHLVLRVLSALLSLAEGAAGLRDVDLFVKGGCQR